MGELVVAVTDEVMPVIRDPSDLYMVVSFILADLLAHHQVCVYKRLRRKYPGYLAEELAQRETEIEVELMKALAAVGLGILLLMQPVLVAGAAPGDQVRQTVDKLLVILKDPRLKEEGNKNERREKLKQLIYQRFDFTEMARRSLGSEWRRRSPEETKGIRATFYRCP